LGLLNSAADKKEAALSDGRLRKNVGGTSLGSTAR
jgi:hypothetical protein